MAKIVRYQGNLPSFASGSTGTNRTVFGDTTQSDTITDNITSEFLEGWEIVEANDAPTRQDFNAIAYTTTEILAYLHQMGTPEWNTAQEYHTGSITTQGGALYISRTDTNVGNNPVSDVVNWKDVSGESFNDTKYVVDPVAGETDYTTIQGAMDAANASGIGSVVYVRPGAYTENLTFYNNIKLKGGDNRQVIITGTHIPPATGTVTIKNVTLISATDAFSSAVAGSADIIMKEVLTNCTNGYTFNLLNWTGEIELDNCHSIGTNDGFLNNTGGADISSESSILGIGSGNTMSMYGEISANNTLFGCPIALSGSGTNKFIVCEFNNNINFTVGSAGYIEGSYLNTGAIIPLSFNSTGDLYLTRVTFNTTDTTAINGTGTGTLYNGILDFTGGSSIDGDISFESSNSLAGGIYGWNGSFVEAATETVTESGGVVTCSVEKEGGGDLTLVSGRGYWHYDTTPADTVTLTVGTDEVPVMNYVYLDGLTKLLTASTSGYPLTGHSPIANILCQSAASIATDGVYKLHSRQNHLAAEQNVGHIGHINNWIRAQHATWMSGVATSFSGDGTGTIGFSNTSGEVLQLHEHTFPAIVDPAPIYCVNDPDTAYRKITNIADLLKDSLGNPLKDRAYGIVFWGCVSEDTGDCKIFCNLPSGDEGDFNKAREDKKKYINYSIPEDFKGTGFLIYRLFIENDNDTTWDLDVAGDGDDLRGQFPSTSAGSSTTVGTEFADSTFRVFDDGDNTKQVALQVSGLTTATTRTMTIPDGDGTVAYNDIAYGGTGANTKTDAFDNLSPTTTEGDIVYYNGFDNTRLAKGTAKQILAMNSGATAPEWSSDVNVTSMQAGNVTISGNTITNTDTNGYTLVDNGQIQPLSGAYDREELLKYLKPIHYKNTNVEASVNTYTHGTTAVNLAYLSNIYSPTQDRLYFIPFGIANNALWHYVDCQSGEIVAYTHGVTCVDNAYNGGVYSPNENRIYFVPYEQADETDWHYIDCNTGTVVAYAHGATAIAQAYIGGSYSPIEDRIYFTPNNIADDAGGVWHYVDCSDGSIVAYTHGATAVNDAYQGSVYSPTENRIYFIPYKQCNQTNWHYVDCSDGSIVAYAHGATVDVSGYVGGAYSPTQNRIYMSPRSQANNTNWHYIDCDDGTVVAYTHVGSSAVDIAYIGSVYIPTLNRIYFVPFIQAPQSNWHYLDCNTGLVVQYAHGCTAVNQAYSCGGYSPKQDRIYFAPYDQSATVVWHYIQSYAEAEIAPQVMAHGIWNKF